MKTKEKVPVQGSLFEVDYLFRTLGSILHSPEIALTELVANAWDAGAARVDIRIPSENGEEIRISDDGRGMTPTEFKQRWMTLAYNRIRHQGSGADFPADRSDWLRPAFGRNGVGRHGMLCFSDSYRVETQYKAERNRFEVSTMSGAQPFVIVSEKSLKAKKHGTCLTAKVSRNLIDPDRIRDVLSARFLHDPRFSVFVNRKSVSLMELPGLKKKKSIEFGNGKTGEIFFIEATEAGRTADYQGIAFWVGGRLVGEPSWILGKRSAIDGRTRMAKQYAVVVRSKDLFDEVLPDWSGFKNCETINDMYDEVLSFVENEFLLLSRKRVQDIKREVHGQNRQEIDSLTALAQHDVKEFIDDLAEARPDVSSETFSAAVKAIINIEKARSGASLLEKLGELNEQDLDALDRLLAEWTVRDALTVLDEVDQRIAVIEAIRKLSGEEDSDELHTLHPLLTQARWVFGPEFDSPEYASNLSLRKAVVKLFGKEAKQEDFLNSKKRPDIVVLGDSTLSVVATESFMSGSSLSSMNRILIIELKKGASTITRENMNQALGYVVDLRDSGHVEGNPEIRAFVVGEKVGAKVEPVYTLGSPVHSTVQAATYSNLVRTAEKRLFGLRDRLRNRYSELTGEDLVEKIAQSDLKQDLIPGM